MLDVSEFDAAQLGAGRWVVLRVAPAAHSGSATLPEAFVDGDTGRLVDASGGEVDVSGSGEVWYEGTYEVIAVLAGEPPPASGQYSWREQQPVVVRGITREHVYNPFGQGGTVVCQFGLAAGEMTPFSHVYLLPDGWEQRAEEAARGPGAPAGLAPEQSPADGLDRQLSSQNPLLSAPAARELARGQRLDEPLLRSTLERTDGYGRAVLHLTALRDAQYLGSDVLRAGFDADFAPGSEPDHRRAAALALLTAQLFTPQAAASIVGQMPLRRDDGLLAAATAAEDPYVREAIRILTPE